ncbi:MAG: hypothetical protein HY302_10250 [Opitutae bacterium]|nr:hypothetical protein [Opitutae bacterium]
MPSPPPTKKSADSVLTKLAAGFSFFIALVWVVEFARVPHLFFGEPNEVNWVRVLMRTAIIAGVWCWVHVTTKRVLKRLHYLEEFLLVCSWCQKVGHDGKWLTLEDYFGSKFNTQTSHGICPECAARATGRPAPIPPLPSD